MRCPPPKTNFGHWSRNRWAIPSWITSCALVSAVDRRQTAWFGIFMLGWAACGSDSGTMILPDGSDAAIPSICVGMDVAHVHSHSECGAARIQGWYWDGTSCQALTGCGCAGADCDLLYEQFTHCLSAMAACVPSGGCRADDIRGTGTCDAILGWRWNGTTCAPVGGCSCAGADCAALRATRLECEAGHSTCTGARDSGSGWIGRQPGRRGDTGTARCRHNFTT